MFIDYAACTALLFVKAGEVVHDQELNVDIRHQTRKSNRVADALSQNPVEVTHIFQFQSVEADVSLNGLELSDLELDIKQLQHKDPQLAPLFKILPAEQKLARYLVLEVELYEVLDELCSL